MLGFGLQAAQKGVCDCFTVRGVMFSDGLIRGSLG